MLAKLAFLKEKINKEKYMVIQKKPKQLSSGFVLFKKIIAFYFLPFFCAACCSCACFIAESIF